MTRIRRQHIVSAPCQHPTDRQRTGGKIEVVNVPNDRNLSPLPINRNPSVSSANMAHTGSIERDIGEQIVHARHIGVGEEYHQHAEHQDREDDASEPEDHWVPDEPPQTTEGEAG